MEKKNVLPIEYFTYLKEQQSIFVAGKTEHSLSLFGMDSAVENEK